MKYSKLRLFVGLLACLLSINAFSQKELKGKVVDFITYEPIESASIYIENSTIGTVSNTDGNFVLRVPQARVNDTLVISSIGFKSFRTAVKDYNAAEDIFLEEDMASLDEVILIADTRPKTGNDIVLRAIKRLPNNLPEQPYLQKGFLRHKEKNKREYKWLIESAITIYDSSYASGAEDNLKINVDENRKSYDLRDVDSLYAYSSYLRNTSGEFKMSAKQLRRDTIATATLVEAIKWNDDRVNGLGQLFKGRLNLMRNANMGDALFGENVLQHHQFRLDTILVDNGRKLYKIEILKGKEYVGLNTKRIYNEGFEPHGWLYIYWDSYAIKKIEYDLIASSDKQKRRSKSLFGTLNNHKLVITYMEYQEKMYPKYFYYETPKLVNVGDRSSDKLYKTDEERKKEREEQFYNTVQEILFTETIQDPELISEALQQPWSEDIFMQRPYNKEFWKNYNVLLESEEEEKLIQDLSKRATLFKQ
ncbi:carboxypeptidase-like regulatory domain-containing protein [Ulvibacter antarcticus]|uniref:Carboxypeptidase-like protein n=1 Tax=Ulvibacter antarcticus TaxID=442714 RepID=A0A3L9Y7M0_9FLAO|nr:carboxypeptidase-like regulatory domain-containing protein [Ulvibacter antarcticus]RMA56706.1 carboxypeptidase-like protein [Ulvibacter antarcticus]